MGLVGIFSKNKMLLVLFLLLLLLFFDFIYSKVQQSQ